MSERRFVDGADDERERRAARLIERMGDAPSLSPSRLAHVRARVEEAARRAWPLRLRRAFAVSLTIATAGAAAAVFRLVAERTRPLVETTAARCETARLAGPGNLRLALAGPGSLAYSADGRAPLALRAGHLAIATGDGNLTVDAAGARVHLSSDSVAEIAIVDGQPEVAAYAGSAEVTWREIPLTVAEGTTWTPSSIRDNRGGDEADRLLDGNSPPICPDTNPSMNPNKNANMNANTNDSGSGSVNGTENVNGNGVGNGNVNGIGIGIGNGGNGNAPVDNPPKSPSPIKPRKLDDTPDPPASPPPPPNEIAPAPPSESRVAAESRALADAVRLLNRERDASASLAALDAYDARFPDGSLRADAALTRAKALRALGRRDDALALLDQLAPAGELLLVRGELRAEADRCRDAIADFDRSLDGDFAERALWDRASCRSRLGLTDGARADLVDLLRRFPDGPHAAEARRALGE